MSGTDHPDGGEAQLWSRPQHAVAYQEARAVLDAQQARKNNLDDKALRTTRLITVVVGALITAVEAFDLTVAEPAGIGGIGLLVLSFGGGIVVYSFSSPILGPSEDDLQWLLWMREDHWEREFITQLGEWIATNTRRLNRNTIVLFLSDIALFVGVLAVLFAIVI